MMEYGYSGSVGLGKPLTHPSNKSLRILFVPNNKCNNKMHLINFHDLFIFVCLIFVNSDNLENLLPLKLFLFMVVVKKGMYDHIYK